VIQRPTRRWPDLDPALLDAIMFAGSAMFAVGLWSVSTLSPHRDWARYSIAGYCACAIVAVVLAVRRPERALHWRAILTGVCFVLVALFPMSLMINERAVAHHQVHVLPEVAVIERAGIHLAHGQDPYVAEVIGHRLIGAVPGAPRYEAFFPYFPAMTVFGLPASQHFLGDLGDARIWMTLATVALFAAGLLLARAPPDRVLRAAQVLFVLPTGALFVAGGGDDLPILGFMFLGLAALVVRRPVTSAITFGLAMAMKLTAWPLALLSLFVVREIDGMRGVRRAGVIMAVIVGVFVVPFAVWDPRTFIVNTIAFPLGLSSVNSPAASPLPGHLIASVVPGAHRALLLTLVAVGSPILVWWLWRRPPRDVPSVCRLTAVVAIVVMCVAPATRVGYIVYPVNLLVWSWLFAAPTSSGSIRAKEGTDTDDAVALDSSSA
jgi:hypothetical protein